MKRLLLFAIFCLLFCGNNNNQIAIKKEKDEKIPDQETWNSTLRWTKNGKEFVSVDFGHMQKFNDSRTYILDDSVIADFYKNGRHTSILYSSKGRINENTKDMTAIGNVKVVSDNGITLLTEELNWVNDKERIVTDKFVTIITELDTIYGYGFESDQELKNWIIEKPKGKSKREIKLE